jgi:xylan 1,4-beta-xylosidase
VMGLDGDRCKGGAEITTYDSLDASLGQARNNLYLGVKGWATYLSLADLFDRMGDKDSADESRGAARRAAATVVGAADREGLLPAVIGEGIEARIIPAIEALVYPFVCGIEAEEYGELRSVLARHFENVLQPGICRFDDGGWRLSSTSQNSWLSKIYLCQFVAERVLGKAPDTVADAAHVAWLVDEENGYFAWSDQMLAGKAVGSRYYPRGVTSALWVTNGDRPIPEIREALFEDATVLAGAQAVEA